MAQRIVVNASLLIFFAAIAILSPALTTLVQANSISRGLPQFTTVVENARPPVGWNAFCARYPNECNPASNEPRIVELTPKTWQLIVSANKWANKNIKPMTDRERWGTINKWVYPDDGYGDCKAYALTKRRILMKAGLPREALLLTIVWTKQNKGHAVLIVRTNKGDFVLDNLTSKVLLWSKTTHDFVKRQSQTDPNAWVFIDGDRKTESSNTRKRRKSNHGHSG